MEQRHQGENFKSEQSVNQLFGFGIVDREGESVGKVENIWVDETDQPAFFGTQSGWLSSKLHVVPAHGSEVNFQRKQIRLPFLKDRVKDAPSHKPNSDLTVDEEVEIYRFYDLMRSSSMRDQSVETREETEVLRDANLERAREENADIQNRPAETDGPRLRRVIQAESARGPIELEHEDVEIVRIPVSEESAAQNAELEEDETYVPLRREEGVEKKEVHASDELIHLRKIQEAERQEIEDTERRKKLETEREDDERRYGT